MATKRSTAGNKLRAGFGRREITPPLPFPLAGMADRKGRLAERVHDPLCARALALSDGATTALVVSCDLLLITQPLRAAVEQRIVAAGHKIAGLLLCATHTHSACGGYWDNPSAALFMGAYQPAIFEHLAANIAAACCAALDDLKPAEPAFGETQTEGLSYNRRHAKGPIDRTLGVLTLRRGQGRDIRVVAFGAHPVLVAFRDYNLVSADYPAALIGLLEQDGYQGMFINGPVGGVNALFPEGPLDADVHLRLLSRLLKEQVDVAAAAEQPIEGRDVAFAAGRARIEPGLPRLFPDNRPWADLLALPLRLYLKRFGVRGLGRDHVTNVPVVRLGELVLCGMPADLGAGVGLAAREMIAQQGLKCLVVASQTDDYVGYVHLGSEYQQFETKDRDAMWMTIYENGLGIGGREVGHALLEALRGALFSVAR